MFDSTIALIEETLTSKMGESVEIFEDIHCDDPFDEKQEFAFPLVGLHSTGLYLVTVLKETLWSPHELKDWVEYSCRVFKSYFHTTAPIRCVLAFREGNKHEEQSEAVFFDRTTRNLVCENGRLTREFKACVERNLESEDDEETDAWPNELERLSSRLYSEESDTLSKDSEAAFCFVKKKKEWADAYNRNSDQVFNFALLGGFIGLHRFYLGLFGSGLLYLFTLGLFGFGWIFDCIEMLQGRWHHKGTYLLPLSNPRVSAIKMVLVFAAIALFAYFKLNQS